MRVRIINGNSSYERMFISHGWEVVNPLGSPVSRQRVDLVCFTGGEDVSPSWYGQKPIPETHSNPNRDFTERKIFHAYKELGTPMVGICRGGQFLNVMCGGSLWQDVTGHAVSSGHLAIDYSTGNTFKVSSAHHQMMRPSPLGKLLAYAQEASVLEDETSILNVFEYKDAEVVLYKGQSVLCFQPHPEYTGFEECTEKFFEYLKEIV
jgi:gamma-glutamyl-gamma-aminobutyrate hydrolase PuuD